MKALVLSDSHNSTWLINSLAEKYRARTDCIIHLGDCTEDLDEIRQKYKSLPIYQVRGNNDYDSLYPSERTITLAGKRIYMTHGHRHRVYYSTDRLYYAAAEEQADIALFGHTHVPYLENECGILVMNPGSITLPRGGSERSFAFITIEGGRATLSVMGYNDGDVHIIRTLTL